MKITLTVNGQVHALDVQPLRRLLDVLREDIGLTGTKEGCGEGECGACAVHIDGVLLNACQVPAYQAHGRNVLTVEGLGTMESPDPLQAAFVAEGAVQCGFCTPGLLMASRALLDANPSPSAHDVRVGLAGNLCRCTGYGRVVKAVRSVAGTVGSKVTTPRAVEPPVPAADDQVQVYMPNLLSEALEILAAGDCTVFAGGTDLMAVYHAGKPLPAKVLDISRLKELTGIILTPRGANDSEGVIIGAAVRYAELHSAEVLAATWPSLVEAARLVGAPAVQNAGTVGGNLVNASPGADLVPVLAALGGQVILVSLSGTRKVPVTEFYRGYRDCDLRPDELVTGVELPQPPEGMHQAFYKAGTRRAQSIARVNLACCARVDSKGCITDVRLVSGSVGPTIMVLNKTMAWLEGRHAMDSYTVTQAKASAASEVTPIDDVRATADYRRTVIGNLVGRFLNSVG